MKVDNFIQTTLFYFKQDIEQANSVQDVEDIKIKYLGKKSQINAYIGTMCKSSTSEEKKDIGRQLNELKQHFEETIGIYKTKLEQEAISKQIESEKIDVTLPVHKETGSMHLLSIAKQRAFNILSSLGMKFVSSNEMEDEWYNFDALNVPADHPARMMHDTFYLNNNKLLRTHTTASDIHEMLKVKDDLPHKDIKTFTIGKVYRRDSDRTHSPVFHQIDGVIINKSVNFANLLWVIETFLKRFFNKNEIKMNIRPSYFPFTEPSAEIDMEHNGEIIEIMGCGMLHQNVLKNVGIDHNQYQGLAFGMGLERITSIMYNVSDLRGYYNRYCL